MILNIRVVFYTGYTYFCCSTLPLLNGDIKRLIDSYQRDNNIIHLDVIHMRILSEILTYQYSKKMSYRIRKEYKRMIALYKYRLNNLGIDWSGIV